MPFIIATGSNLKNRKDNLLNAKNELSKFFSLVEESNIYTSKAVDYENQPDFYNQVLLFKSPSVSPDELMTLLLKIETKLGRTREINRGPRIIDIDLLFFDNHTSNTNHLILPHPRLFLRSFVVLPLMELNYFSILNKDYEFNTNFDNSASILNLT